MTAQVQVPPVGVMVDETLMLHLELRHGNDLSMQFLPEPDRTERRLAGGGRIWRIYHETLHRMHPEDYDHIHNDPEGN